jgi:DNA-directed RNA polymerase specialized sigma24 family protein
MMRPDDKRVREYEKIVSTAAKKFRHAAEYDDLYQEGLIAVWKCSPEADIAFVRRAVYNRMKDWVRYTKRLRHYQSVSYEEMVDGEV